MGNIYHIIRYIGIIIKKAFLTRIQFRFIISMVDRTGSVTKVQSRINKSLIFSFLNAPPPKKKTVREMLQSALLNFCLKSFKTFLFCFKQLNFPRWQMDTELHLWTVKKSNLLYIIWKNDHHKRTWTGRLI